MSQISNQTAINTRFTHPQVDTAQSQQLYCRAKEVIPGGSQLLSKRPEMYAPEQWPGYYQSANGAEVIDLDGNIFLDMSTNGVGSCLLGYADPDVTAAVVNRVQRGTMCSLNPPEEVELAELLIEIHPWAEKVRFLRTGGEAMAAAVRIARAASDRDVIAFCGYHGWHDWYLAANRQHASTTDELGRHLLPGLSPAGVPSSLSGTAFAFAYNEIDKLAAIVRQHGKNLAAVVMEPTRNIPPKAGFLENVRKLCDQSGAALIVDEITAGWRFTNGGAHLLHNFTPDIAVFGKALGNGHPMAAIIGTAAVMEAAQSSFISSTYWTEGVGPVAAIATLKKMQKLDVPAHVKHIGLHLRSGLQAISLQHGVPLKLSGHPQLTTIGFDHPHSVALSTLLTVRMLDHGILTGSSFYPTWAHQDTHVAHYLGAADIILPELAEAVRMGDAESRIGGPVKQTGFRRLT